MSTTITHKQVVLDGNYRTTVLQLEAIVNPLPAFTVLGKKGADGAITATAEASGENTGNGTLTLDVSTPTLEGVKIGAYKVEVTKAYEEGPVAGTFIVTDPAGNPVDEAGTIDVAWEDELKFTLAEGSTKFEVGDIFTITVEQALGTGDLAAWDPDASDGSEVPYALLAQDAEVIEDEQFVSVYLSGRFNADEVIVPDGYTADNAFDGLRDKGILLVHQADIGRNPAVVE